MRATFTTAMLGVVALLSASSAAASARPGYENVPNAAGENGFPAASTVDPGSGTLPFTGMNLVVLVVLGCLVLGCGLLLRRAAER